MISLVICWVLTVANLFLLAHIVFSWVPSPPTPLLPVIRFVRRVVEPLLAPIRRIMPPVQMGGMALDTSVLVVFILIFILRGIFC